LRAPHSITVLNQYLLGTVSTSSPSIQQLKAPSSTTLQHNHRRRITSLSEAMLTPRQRSYLSCRAPEMTSCKRSQSAAWRTSHDYYTNMWSVSVIRPRLGWRYIARLRCRAPVDDYLAAPGATHDICAGNLRGHSAVTPVLDSSGRPEWWRLHVVRL
jgi:hypothetical protein